MYGDTERNRTMLRELTDEPAAIVHRYLLIETQGIFDTYPEVSDSKSRKEHHDRHNGKAQCHSPKRLVGQYYFTENG